MRTGIVRAIADAGKGSYTIHNLHGQGDIMHSELAKRKSWHDVFILAAIFVVLYLLNWVIAA
jgi:hypothetical protein